MKRYLSLAFILFFFFSMLNFAWAQTYDLWAEDNSGNIINEITIESDYIDNLKATANFKYNIVDEYNNINDPIRGKITKEQQWVEEILNYEVEFTKFDYRPLTYFVENDDSLRAFELIYQPDYYMIKTGKFVEKGQPVIDFDVFLFSNLANIDWALFDLDDIGLDGKYELFAFDKISHWGETGNNPIPEPATMLLLGAGLISLAGVCRRKLFN